MIFVYESALMNSNLGHKHKILQWAWLMQWAKWSLIRSWSDVLIKSVESAPDPSIFLDLIAIPQKEQLTYFAKTEKGWKRRIFWENFSGKYTYTRKLVENPGIARITSKTTTSFKLIWKTKTNSYCVEPFLNNPNDTISGWWRDKLEVLTMILAEIINSSYRPSSVHMNTITTEQYLDKLEPLTMILKTSHHPHPW